MRSLEFREWLVGVERLLQRPEDCEAAPQAVLLRGRDGTLVHPGDEEDLRRAVGVREIAQRTDAVVAGHLEVQNHDVGLHCFDELPQAVGRRRRRGTKAGSNADRADRIDDLLIVVEREQHGVPLYRAHVSGPGSLRLILSAPGASTTMRTRLAPTCFSVSTIGP